MNYQAFTKDSLTMMCEGIRGALAADDVLKNRGEETRFRVRETPDWKSTPLISKAKCSSVEFFFEDIDWSEDQAQLPFER
jgi:hypothetical protein